GSGEFESEFGKIPDGLFFENEDEDRDGDGEKEERSGRKLPTPEISSPIAGPLKLKLKLKRRVTFSSPFEEDDIETSPGSPTRSPKLFLPTSHNPRRYSLPQFPSSRSSNHPRTPIRRSKTFAHHQQLPFSSIRSTTTSSLTKTKTPKPLRRLSLHSSFRPPFLIPDTDQPQASFIEEEEAQNEESFHASSHEYEPPSPAPSPSPLPSPAPSPSFAESFGEEMPNAWQEPTEGGEEGDDGFEELIGGTWERLVLDAVEREEEKQWERGED
ncbi:hypothetical protein P7C70_g8115, partial [Phenoliferia sp. Uapishka_3]